MTKRSAMPGRWWSHQARRPLLRAALAAQLILVVGAGCSAGDDGDVSPSTLAGRIDVDGSSTVEPFTALAAERFQNEHPRVAVVVGVSPSRTGGGFERFCLGETDLSTASRRIELDETQACRERGIRYVEFQIASDAITVVVNPDNDWADCLTTGELKKIWEPGSAVDSWSDVRRRFPDQELELFGASEKSGTFDYFSAEIVGREGASRSDFTAHEDDFDTAREVAEAKGALGYFGFFHFSEDQDRLKALEIDDGSGCVAPSVEAVQTGEYATLSRPLFIYAKKDALMREPSVRAFVEYALDNAITLANDAFLIPVSDEQLARERAKFDAIQVAGDDTAPPTSTRAASGARSGA